MFEEETNRFFNRFYQISCSGKAVKKGSAKKLDDFCKNYYFFKVKTFLPPRIVIDDKETRILDLGCGSGNYLFYLVKEKKQGVYYGTDISKEAIKKVREIATKDLKELTDNNIIKLWLSVQNAQKLNFKDDFFDYVYIVSVLHHVEKYKEVLNEAHRVLKKDGELIIVDLPKDRPISRLGRKIIKYLPKKTKDLLFERDLLIESDFPKRSNVTAKKVKNYLEESGFDIEEEEYHYLFFHYLIYFYKICPVFFKLTLPINKLLIKFENKLKRFFKDNCGLYVFVCRK